MSVQFQARNVSPPRSTAAVSKKSKPRRQRQRASGQDLESGAETDESLNEDASSSSSSEESDLSSHSSSQSSARSNGLANSLTLSGEGVGSPATSEGDGSNIAKQASASSLVSDLETSAATSTSHTSARTRQKSSRRSSAISYDQSELPQDSRRPKRMQKDSSSPAVPPTSNSSSPEEANRPHVDLASYPTAHLLHLLAELLQQIASANENLRPAGQTTFSFPSSSSPQSNQVPSGSGVLPDTAENTLARSTPFMTPFDINETAAAHAEDYFSSQAAKDGDDDTDMTSAPPTPFTLYQPMPSTSKGYRDSAVLTASKSALKSSSGTLCFHARNVPGIAIEQYLLRILKYCPTTNEVFIALLVYFDRMAQMTQKAACGMLFTTPESTPQKPRHAPRIFAVDAFNIHRLLIAGVTVASKFFSDVFYTNSRYAKVGGLPLHELNQLELQFLLLNDFSLVVPLEEMQRYADGLLLYFKDAQQKPATDSQNTTPAKKPFRPSPALGHMRSYSNGMTSSTSESGSSTVGPRSDCSSVASTGTVRMESSRESSDVEDDGENGSPSEDKRME